MTETTEKKPVITRDGDKVTIDFAEAESRLTDAADTGIAVGKRLFGDLKTALGGVENYVRRTVDGAVEDVRASRQAPKVVNCPNCGSLMSEHGDHYHCTCGAQFTPPSSTPGASA